MSIISFITKISAQTALYWGTPVNDGYGGTTYADPVEIKCRWDDTIKMINNKQGEELISNAEIITNEELEEGGLLYLGTLDDLELMEDSNTILSSTQFYVLPNQIEGDVYKIATKSKVPLLRSNTQFVLQYYLKPNWETKL